MRMLQQTLQGASAVSEASLLQRDRMSADAAAPLAASEAIDRPRLHVQPAQRPACGAAFLLVYPDYQLVVALASNAYAQWGEREALNIAAVFLNRDRP
jgi:hypothetical protein